jgi:hypothetical protein
VAPRRWALGGLYLSLGPSLAAQATGSPNLLWGGLVIFLLCGTGEAAVLVLRSISSRAAMLAGCLFLLVGVAATFGAIAATTSAAFLAGTSVAGVGFGPAFLGAFRMTTALARPGQRASLLALRQAARPGRRRGAGGGRRPGHLVPVAASRADASAMSAHSMSQVRNHPA